jgi:hypothetical protein
MLSIPTSLDGYEVCVGGSSGTAPEFHTAGPVSLMSLTAPDGKQFLGACGELVAIDADGHTLDVLPISVTLVGSPGSNCVQVDAKGVVPDDDRLYAMTITAIAVTQALNVFIPRV